MAEQKVTPADSLRPESMFRTPWPAVLLSVILRLDRSITIRSRTRREGSPAHVCVAKIGTGRGILEEPGERVEEVRNVGLGHAPCRVPTGFLDFRSAAECAIVVGNDELNPPVRQKRREGDLPWQRIENHVATATVPHEGCAIDP